MARFTMTPCPMRLAEMDERADGWHCGRCNKTVVDLSNATEADVQARLSTGELCGRARTTSTGRLLLVGAAAIGLSGLAHADSDVPIPPMPEEETTEVCDGTQTDGVDTEQAESSKTPPSSGEDEHGAENLVPIRPDIELETFTYTLGYIHYTPRRSNKTRQSPAESRAERLAKRAERISQRAESARAQANAPDE